MGKMLYAKRAHLWQHTTRTEFTYPEPLFSFRHVVFKSRVALVTRMRAPRQRKKESNSFTVKFLNKFSFIITFLYLKFQIKIATVFTLSKTLVSNFYLFESYQKYLHRDKGNRPFYRYDGHIELIRFKEYYGMPRGHEHDPKKIVMGKKVVVPCLDVIMIAFSREIYSEVLFLPEKRA